MTRFICHFMSFSTGRTNPVHIRRVPRIWFRHRHLLWLLLLTRIRLLPITWLQRRLLCFRPSMPRRHLCTVHYDGAYYKAAHFASGHHPHQYSAGHPHHHPSSYTGCYPHTSAAIMQPCSAWVNPGCYVTPQQQLYQKRHNSVYYNSITNKVSNDIYWLQ